MGAAASTARDNLDIAAVTTSGETPLTCKLSDDQVTAFVSSSNFTSDEVAALHIHFDLISSATRDDGLIDRGEFQTALGFTVKESLYVDRIFQLFDANDDNCISFSEFLQSVSLLSSKGSTAEKIKFSFDILDFDRDGMLSPQELLKSLEACIQENGINIPAGCLDTIVAKTMEDVDLDKDGFISFNEFQTMTEANLQMLNHVTLNVSAIIAEYMPALRTLAANRGRDAITLAQDQQNEQADARETTSIATRPTVV